MPSNREVATYDLAPEMSAAPVTDGVVSALQQSRRGRPARSSWSTTPTPTWSATPACSSRRSRRHRDDRRLHRPHRRAPPRRRRGGVHHRRPRQLRDDDRSRDRPAAHGAHHQPGPVHRHRRRAWRGASCAAAGGCATSRRRSSNTWASPQPPEMDGVSLLRKGTARKMSIGKRLIDLARAELNSLLDRAARVDGDDDDDRERRRYGSASTRRCPTRSSTRSSSGGARRARRPSRPPRPQADRPEPARPRVGAAAAHGRRRRGDPQGLRRAGGAAGLGLRDRAQARVPTADAQVPPRPHTRARRKSSARRPSSRSG